MMVQKKKISKNLRQKKQSLNFVAEETSKFKSFFAIICIAVFFVVLLYFFQNANAFVLSQIFIIILFASMLIIFSVMARIRTRDAFFELKTTNRIIMLGILFFVIYLIFMSDAVKIIFFYLALLMISIALQKLMFFLSFKETYL